MVPRVRIAAAANFYDFVKCFLSKVAILYF